MARLIKLIELFFENPSKLRHGQIEKILLYFNFSKVPAKGSHTKFKHKSLAHDLIFPVHNNECKDFYKKQAASIIKKYLRDNP